MNRWVKNSLRFSLVTVGVVVLTSFTIDATDTFRGSQSALSILADRATDGSCPKGMVKIDGGNFCVDMYEAVPSQNCPVAEPRNVGETASNVNALECFPASKKDQLPWTNVTYTQAEALCAKAGKRLPKVDEWYRSALGTPDNQNACNINGSLRRTDQTQCVAGSGAYDMIGNVWEFVNGSVEDSVFKEQILPPEGYVETLADNGLAKTTTSTPQVVFNNDYFWSNPSGTYSVMKGGFHGSGPDAGIYTTHAAVKENFASAAIGFRCVLSL